MEDRIKRLELRITELENKLKQAAPAAQPSIDPEDLKTYQKVEAQLGQIACYVCRPYICRPCWPPLCICPCGPGACYQCGPCIAYAGGAGGSGFGGFMQ